jgi:hypothetical protein
MRSPFTPTGTVCVLVNGKSVMPSAQKHALKNFFEKKSP